MFQAEISNKTTVVHGISYQANVAGVQVQRWLSESKLNVQYWKDRKKVSLCRE